MNKWLYTPTVKIQAVCSVIFACNLYISYFILEGASLWYFPIFMTQVLVMIKTFTPIHEGSHGLLSPKKWLNEILFTLLWPIFPFGPHLFRMVHLIHHGANGKKGIDPDLYTHGKTKLSTIFRCGSMIFYCLYYIISRSFKAENSIQRSFIAPNIISRGIIAFYILGQALLISLSFGSEYALPFALSWFIPSIVAIGIVTYYNAVLTHRDCSYKNVFQSSNILAFHPLVNWFLCDQNLHFVHHFRPQIPWYEYREFWTKFGEMYAQKGVNSFPPNPYQPGVRVLVTEEEKIAS